MTFLYWLFYISFFTKYYNSRIESISHEADLLSPPSNSIAARSTPEEHTKDKKKEGKTKKSKMSDEEVLLKLCESRCCNVQFMGLCYISLFRF